MSHCSPAIPANPTSSRDPPIINSSVPGQLPTCVACVWNTLYHPLLPHLSTAAVRHQRRMPDRVAPRSRQHPRAHPPRQRCTDPLHHRREHLRRLSRSRRTDPRDTRRVPGCSRLPRLLRLAIPSHASHLRRQRRNDDATGRPLPRRLSRRRLPRLAPPANASEFVEIRSGRRTMPQILDVNEFIMRTPSRRRATVPPVHRQMATRALQGLARCLLIHQPHTAASTGPPVTGGLRSTPVPRLRSGSLNHVLAATPPYVGTSYPDADGCTTVDHVSSIVTTTFTRRSQA